MAFAAATAVASSTCLASDSSDSASASVTSLGASETASATAGTVVVTSFDDLSEFAAFVGTRPWSLDACSSFAFAETPCVKAKGHFGRFSRR